MSYDLIRWRELVADRPDLEDCPEEKRGATLEQAFGISDASPLPVKPVYTPHEWRRKVAGTVDGFYVSAADGYYTCTRCGHIASGDLCFATNGDMWTEAPRGAGSCEVSPCR